MLNRELKELVALLEAYDEGRRTDEEAWRRFKEIINREVRR